MRDASKKEHGVVFLVLDEHVDRLAAVIDGEAEVFLCRTVYSVTIRRAGREIWGRRSYLSKA